MTDDVGVYAVIEPWEGPNEAFVSPDLGQTWQPTDAELETSSPACGTDGTCFRLVDDSIERKLGGEDWEAVWSIPTEREDYVGRHGTGHSDCPGVDMLFTTDIVAVEEQGDSAGVAGMGDQGLVVIRGDDVSRIGVAGVGPSEFSGSLLNSGFEVVLIALAALLLVFPASLVIGSTGLSRQTYSFMGKLVRGALAGATLWIGLMLVPYELWARGVVDSYDAVVKSAQFGGVMLGIVIAWYQRVRIRRLIRESTAAVTADGPGV